MEERVEYHSDHIETVTLHAGTCTRSRVITYDLVSSSWTHRANNVEERSRIP